MNVGQEILVLRAEKGWTQQQFAEKLKTSQRTIAAWEAGDSVPRKTMKVKIAQVFGLPPNHFLDSETNGLTEERIETDQKTNGTAREKDVMEDIENIVSSAYQEIDEEKKSQVIESIQGILNTIERK
jgi:transcriptional regulator with XRE-family HTH domain